jgi:hypothetical protein
MPTAGQAPLRCMDRNSQLVAALFTDAGAARASDRALPGRLSLVAGERLVQRLRDARCTWRSAAGQARQNRRTRWRRDGLGKPLAAIRTPWLDFNGAWLQDRVTCDQEAS